MAESIARSMMLHCGAEQVDRDFLRERNDRPIATDTYHPVAHNDLLEHVEQSLDDAGLEIQAQSHGLTREGDRYFGVLQVAERSVEIPGDGASLMDQFGCLIGLRNSHDKSFSAALCMGARVFVCDNLSFTGEQQIGRRHTKHIMKDLPGLVSRATARLIEGRGHQHERFEKYAETFIDNRSASHLIINAAQQGALPKSKVLDVVDQWQRPNHPEFKDRNAWSLYNAFTEVYKTQRLETTVKRSQSLHGMLDNFCSVALPNKKFGKIGRSPEGSTQWVG